MAAKTKTKPIENDVPISDGNADIDKDSKAEEKKLKKAEKKKNKKNKKKGKGKIIFGLILLLAVGAGIAVFGFNVFNLRDEYVYPALRELPVVGEWIPETENVQQDEYSGVTREQLIVQNKKLESEKKALQEDKNNLTKRISDNDKEMTRLKEVEAEQLKFKSEKEAFDKMIAENDPNAYKNYYESVYPENADKIYKETIQNEAADKKVKEYVQTFESMKKDAAAKVLEQMTGTDMNLVVRILNNISPEQRGAILGAMDTEKAAAAVKQMAPKESQQ